MENFSEHPPFLPPSSEQGSDKDAEDTDKKKKKTRSQPFSQKEQLFPAKDEKAEKIAKTVEALLWRREEDRVSEGDKPHQETEGEIQLSGDEVRVVAIEHVEERQEEVRDELALAESGTAAEAVAKANELLLEKDAEHLKSPDETLDAALDAAAAETERVILAGEAAAEHITYAPAPEQMQPETAPLARPQPTVPYASAAPTAWRSPVESVEPAVSTPQPEARRTIFNYFTRKRSKDIVLERGTNSVREKLEKQVRQVRELVSVKERRIRKLAANHYEQQTLQADGQTGSFAESYIGRMQAERLPAASPEIVPIPQAEKVVLVPEQKSVQMMTHQELLKVSEKIIVEGASLRSIYESKRITEKGLRRLVGEYYRGGNLKKRLAKEMIEHERDFERDPQLRDHFAGAGIEAGGTAATFYQDSQEPAVNAAQPAPKRPASKLSLAEVATSPRNLAMTAWVSLIVLLAIVAAILLLTKK